MKLELFSQIFEPDRLYIPEKRLQKLWIQSLWKKNLQTLDGDMIQVLSPGTWNHHEGPDFQGALLFIGDSMKEGDIEIHYNNGDWYTHRHHQNPAYNHVVLHLIFSRTNHERSVVTSQGRHVPLCLVSYDALYEMSFDAVCQSISYAPIIFFKILEDHGFKRLTLKVDYIRRCSARFDYDLLCWWGLFQSLGLKANRSSFNRLFLSFPWEAYKSENMQREEIPELLAYLAGFSQSEILNKKYATLEIPHDLNWVFMGVRPASHPQNRLKWLGVFLMKYYGTSLFETCKDRLFKEGFSRVFWHRFFHVESRDCMEPGESLSLELAMNALVPVLLASMSPDNEMYKMMVNGIKKLSVPEYHLSCRFYTRHNIDSHHSFRRKWVIQQGILYIQERYCSQDLAAICPLCNREENGES